MKLILIVLFSLAVNASAQVVGYYSCKSENQDQDQNQNEATLQVNSEKTIVWMVHTQGNATSTGNFVGMRQGDDTQESLYDLVDFFRTDSGRFILALPAEILSSPTQMEVTEYFQNDDKADESFSVYNCTKN